MRRVEVVVRGRVQGVGYRYSCRNEAQRLGLAGWVRNEPDGTVRAEFEGRAEEVDSMVSWCWEGPDYARVTGVEVREIAPTGGSGFTVG
ncbi:acylphosphatase [Tessaracoccus palaemonis]|uniref:acylphosphatase n=1 Tax=Tessaracoccus palaemonis TaxID=2829499 RepID=A0ABX8SF81_9ACTN|nr:acylphosphatase [Tessaracoccus palaemonis]QXT61614.1 acylphosphatase [Tessaracoccus palaemonis]